VSADDDKVDDQRQWFEVRGLRFEVRGVGFEGVRFEVRDERCEVRWRV
jgi:hypothetical protein